MPFEATPPRRRGRPPSKPAPPASRRKMLDAARADALMLAHGSRDLFPEECGSHGAQWFVVRSKPRSERIAASELRAQGFLVFVPTEVVWRGHHGARRPIARPCVPRYLFVRFDPAADPWRCIWSTRGVATLISYSPERPAPCRASDVRAVWEAIAEPLRQADPTAPQIAIGDRVSPASGPFSAFHGDVVSIAPDGRLVVRMIIFGRSTPITLEPHAVRPAR